MGRAGLVAKPIAKAQARHPLAPSRISGPLVWLGRFIVLPYLHFALFFRKVEIRNPGRLLEVLRSFQEKRIRLIVTFRHPYGDEPQLLFHIFENLVHRLAKQLKMPLVRKAHVRTVHGYEVPLWGGPLIRFILPRVGAVPVYHAKFDPESLMTIRRILSDDPNPLALAPEGQISYHSEKLPRIEQGAVRMGFWCVKDLKKAGRPETVQVLPLSIHYQYDQRDKKKLLSIISRLEALCGLPVVSGSDGARFIPDTLPPRLDSIENRILDTVEEFYRKTYGYQPQSSFLNDAAMTDRHRRWVALQGFALGVAENLLGITPNSNDHTQRMYRVRLEGWDRIYPWDSTGRRSPLESGLAHRQTGEAWYAMRHMEFVDLMSYHNDDYLRGAPGDGPSYDRTVECVLNLADLVSRLLGGNISNRLNTIRKKAIILPGPCLDLTERLPEYQMNNKKAVCDASDALAGLFEDCIKEYLHGKER